MMRSTLLIAAITTLFTIALGVNSGIAKQVNGKEKNSARQTEQTNENGTGHHDSINSGRDFGQHVKEHNDHFSGDHNPGKNHKGYSGLKK